MAKVIGIGGVFIHMKGESKALFEWYHTFLGMEFSAYGTGFVDGEQLMTITFKRDDSEEMPYLNLRVDNLQSIIDTLKKEKIKIISDVTAYEYGKFATFIDPFGNPIELWEANPEKYKDLVKTEIKKYEKHKIPMI